MIIHVRYAIMVAAINMAGGVSLSAADIGSGSSYRTLTTDNPGRLPDRFSVMAYNVKGLPWPIAHGRTQAIDEIGRRLRVAREQGSQPHVVVLQEAFGDTAQRIADRAGYRVVAMGPDAAEQARYVFDKKMPRDWSRGENIGKSLNSGLAILSDFPLRDVKTLAFGDQACAGFDCLANKGVMTALVDMPGYAAPVQLFNVHLNSRKASGVETGKANRAFRRQLMIATRFVEEEADPAVPMIFAGDFNIGKDEERRATFASLSASGHLPEFVTLNKASGSYAINAGLVRDRRQWEDMIATVRRSKDLIFADPVLKPVAAHIRFGTEADGSSLSDHVGYQIDYALPDHRRRKAPVHIAANETAGPLKGGSR